MEEIGPAEVQGALEGVAYPAAKRDLLAWAEGGGAQGPVLAALEMLPDRRYGSAAEVTEALAEIQFGLDLQEDREGVVIEPEVEG